MYQVHIIGTHRSTLEPILVQVSKVVNYASALYLAGVWEDRGLRAIVVDVMTGEEVGGMTNAEMQELVFMREDRDRWRKAFFGKHKEAKALTQQTACLEGDIQELTKDRDFYRLCYWGSESSCTDLLAQVRALEAECATWRLQAEGQQIELENLTDRHRELTEMLRAVTLWAEQTGHIREFDAVMCGVKSMRTDAGS